jgi:type II secretory ATPase GspE/PulE/Tfp pilus assembly ATPase PilB-like protein
LSRAAPDSTDKLLLSLLRSAAAGEAGEFIWPAPPHYEFTEGGGMRARDCAVIFNDGAREDGVLEGFFPDEAQVRFRPVTERHGATIVFSDLLGLHLTRPLAVRRQSHAEGGQELQAAAVEDRQPFSIELVNGKTLSGESVGYVQALCGFFLFLPEKNDRVTRYFVPAHAVRSSSFGKPLGKMLVEENLASPEAVDAALQKQLALRSRTLGEYLTQNQIVSQAQLAAALKQQRGQPDQKLGETLVELGFLTQADLGEALAIEAKNRSIPLGQILADMGVVDPEVINGVMARKLGIPSVNLRSLQIAPEMFKRIPAALAMRYSIVPVMESENWLVVAVEDPMNFAMMEELRFVTGSKLIPVMATADDIRYALEKGYGPARDVENAALSSLKGVAIEELTSRLAAESGEAELGEQHAAAADTTLVRLVNKIILDAVAQGASDIHVEANPGGKTTRVRFRKDGALVLYLDMAARFSKAVISRIKIMSSLDITEHRKPQDGKIEFRRFGPSQVELRVATIPTAGGLEDVVMRVLAAATPVPLDKLGFDAASLAAIKRLISRPYGMFLVCGPTGSGKTTTLHSLLAYLNTPDTKIWTAEDPIEIAQAGLRQVQVNAKIGWTFAAAMRSFMRADPDVIMVGEMRDAETAKIGVEASLTGHLVMSTLHTNSAPESVTRLLDLGMDPFNFADALLGVLAQRLVRRLCTDCKQAYEASSSELEALAAEYCLETAIDPEKLLQGWRKVHGAGGKITLHRTRGCERCDRTGYRGRMGLYELLVADPAVKRLVQTRAPVTEVAAAAMAKGMRTLKQDGIAKVLQGLTDMSQVRTV